MASTLDLLNDVLRSLREPQSAATTTISDDYELQLLQFLNIAKDEVENAWDWQALRNTVTVTGVASQSVYTLTSAADADQDVGIRARLLYQRSVGHGEWYEVSTRQAGSPPQAWDVTTANADQRRLIEISPEQMEMKHLSDSGEEVDTPSFFTIYRDADEMFFRVWPTPDNIRTWKLRFIIPQDRLTAASADTTVLQVSDTAVWLRALYYANQERGEEMGRPGGFLDKNQMTALADAVRNERTDADDTGWPV